MRLYIVSAIKSICFYGSFKHDKQATKIAETIITDIFMLQKLVWDFVQPIAIQESGNILR